jgi:hypothetical protein
MYQWFCCVYFCLPIIINPMYIQYLGEIVPPPSQNTVGVCNQITVVILHYISSRLITLLKVIDAPLKFPNIFYLTVSIKFMNFSFQICILFVPEMSGSITSYIVQIICIVLVWVTYSFHFSVLFLSKKLNILNQTMVYAASILAVLDSF